MLVLGLPGFKKVKHVSYQSLFPVIVVCSWGQKCGNQKVFTSFPTLFGEWLVDTLLQWLVT